MTDKPALALGVDPPDVAPQTAAAPQVIRGRWVTIVLAGVVIAAGTLFVLDASLPGGLVGGRGDATRRPWRSPGQHQIFNVFNARSDERSAFLVSGRWLWGGGARWAAGACHLHPVSAERLLHVLTELQSWLVCIAVASTVVWARERNRSLCVDKTPDGRRGTGGLPPHRAVGSSVRYYSAHRALTAATVSSTSFWPPSGPTVLLCTMAL